MATLKDVEIRKQDVVEYLESVSDFSFETHVQSAFAVLMLARSAAPCLPSWPINKIKLQGKYDGFDTDDCIFFVDDSQHSPEHILSSRFAKINW